MNKEEFYNYIVEDTMQGKETEGNRREREIINNVLDEAEGMEEMDQYNFLCRMITNIPERVIRRVCY